MSYKTPSEQATEYAKRVVELWNHVSVGRLLPTIRQHISDAPPDVLSVAFIAPSTYGADTTDTKPGKGWRNDDGSYQRGAFHEIGWYQVPAGDAVAEQRGASFVLVSVAPTGNGTDTWSKLVDDREVMRALGGNKATTRPGGWRRKVGAKLVAAVDQHAVGLAQLRDDYRSARGKLPERLRPTSSVTQWGCFVTFASFSAGPSKVPLMCSRWETDLASRSEGDRAGRLIECICRDYASGKWVPSSKGNHGNLAHTAARTWQKLALAERLAATIGQPVAQWQPSVRDRVVAERVLVAAAMKRTVSDADKAVVALW